MTFVLPNVLKACGSLMPIQHGKAVNEYALEMGFLQCVYILAVSWASVWRMSSENLRYDSATLASILSAAAVKDDLKLRKGAHCDCIRNYLESVPAIAGNIIEMYCDRIGSAGQVFDNSLQIDLIMWNTLTSSSAELGLEPRSFKIIPAHANGESATRCGIVEFVDTWVSQQWQKAKLGFGLTPLRENNSQLCFVDALDEIPKVATSIPDMYAKAGRAEEAQKYFDTDMKKDVAVYNAMISCNAGQWKSSRGTETVSELQLDGFQPDCTTFTGILTACSHSGLVDESMAVMYEKMDEYNVKPRLSIAESMAQQSWDAEKMLDVYIYDYLIKRKFHATARAFVAEKLVSTVPVAIDAPHGLLLEWWMVFWDVFNARFRTPSDNAASTMQFQDQHAFGFPPQKQHQMQVSHLSNVLQSPLQHELQYRQARAPQLHELDEERMRILTNRNSLIQEDPRLYGMAPSRDANSLLKQKQHLQQSVRSQYTKNGDCIQQHIRAFSSAGGVHVDQCLPNDLVGSNHNFHSACSTNFQKASNSVGQKRKEFSPALDSVITGYLDHSRARPALHFPTTVQSATEQPPYSCQGGGCNNTNYAMVESELFLPTTVPTQTNIGLTSSATHAEDLICPTPTSTTQPVSKGPTINDNGALQVESVLLQTNADVGENHIQLDVGGKGYIFSAVRHMVSGLAKVECCHFSSDGKLLAAGGCDNKVTLWCAESFQIKSELGEHAQAITDIRFSTHMPWLASSSVDGTIRVWDTNNPIQSICMFTGHSAAVSSVDFHPQKDDLICSCDNMKEIRYWTMKNGRCAGMIKGGATCLRFQPGSGKFLATAGKNVVSLYDVETQFCRHRIQDHKSTVHALCWDFAGDHLASVSDDLVSVWRGSGNNMESVHRLSCLGNKFRSCVFHPVLPSVLIIGCDKSLELWNMAENKRVTLDAHQDLISSLSASNPKSYVASGSHDKSIKVWK
ncbi:hypothetical protein MLD38_014806 [Melastoma candidum]|uniref:Uncharacterized protein n=1 Tax=Melastoma candidum TaxID=119954 RepID=A0ACB9RMF7_9MYRT|nr:hypothetical protein MLD38_014806 [Melastoma candidum]